MHETQGFLDEHPGLQQAFFTSSAELSSTLQHSEQLHWSHGVDSQQSLFLDDDFPLSRPIDEQTQENFELSDRKQGKKISFNKF